MSQIDLKKVEAKVKYLRLHIYIRFPLYIVDNT